jgi:hyperosmotically inducible periplasmic protein
VDGNTPASFIKTKKEEITMKKTAYRSACIAAVLSLFAFNVCAFAADMDDRIESTAKQSYAFKKYLQGDDITVDSKDGVVTLTGTVSEESHQILARETVAGLPGVKSVENKLCIRMRGSLPR